MTQMKSSIFLIIISIFLILKVKSISPLRFGPDQTSNDIQIQYFYIQDDPNTSSYMIILNKKFEYLKSNTQFSFCFALMKIITSQDTINCSIQHQNNHYDCLTIQTYQDQIRNYTYWKMDMEFNVASNISNYELIFYQSTNILVQLSGMVGGKPFTFLNQSNRIYKVVTTNAKNFNSGINIKTNYLSTIAIQLQFNSDNVLMQRQVVCYYYKNIINLLFLGGVVRNNQPNYMLSALHYQKDKQTFIMWQGLAFSRDKASRDMIGINPVTETVQDLYSLYARSPFPDVRKNINATQDWNIFSRATGETPFVPTWHYQTHIYRLYDTQDEVGDEIIRFKIQNKYCYVASFMKNESFSDQIIKSFTYTNNNYYHELTQCFTPFLDLYNSMYGVLISCIIIIFLI